MPTVIEEVQSYADNIDTETNNIASRLAGLRGQLAGAGTPEQVDTILAPVLARLKAVGTTPPTA